jgi:hypothetical protein
MAAFVTCTTGDDFTGGVAVVRVRVVCVAILHSRCEKHSFWTSTCDLWGGRYNLNAEKNSPDLDRRG